ncbi:lysophospholipid acyltransferase family protein [Phormidesmis priestleyi]
MPESAKVAPWLYWSLLPIHRAFLHLYFGQITIYGRENLPEKGPMVLASKHFSRWDPLVLALLSTEPLWFMSRSDQMTGIQGWLLKRLGAFSIDSTRSKVSGIRCATNLLHDGKKLVIFPEGRIVRDETLQTLKPGLARLVIQAETTAEQSISISVVPIALHYSPIPRPGAKVSIYIAPPLSSEQYRQPTDKQTAQVLTEALQEKISRGLEVIKQSENSPEKLSH